MGPTERSWPWRSERLGHPFLPTPSPQIYTATYVLILLYHFFPCPSVFRLVRPMRSGDIPQMEMDAQSLIIFVVLSAQQICLTPSKLCCPLQNSSVYSSSRTTKSVQQSHDKKLLGNTVSSSFLRWAAFLPRPTTVSFAMPRIDLTGLFMHFGSCRSLMLSDCYRLQLQHGKSVLYVPFEY